MKNMSLIIGLMVLCLLLTMVTLVAPVMHAAVFSYLSLSVCIVLGVICVAGIFSYMLHR